MPRFDFRAIGADGAALQGSDDAASAKEVARMLQKRGAVVLGVTPARTARGWLNVELGRAALRRGELTEATRELASLLGAGQDLDRALRLIAEEASNRRAQAVFGRLRDAVRGGSPLANAMAREPASFPRLYIGLVRAGEAGGDLGGTLARLAELMERARSLNAAVQSAMIYPAVLAIAAVGAITLLLTQVLPQFVPLFSENGIALPASTAFLLGLGQTVASYGLYAVFAMAVSGTVLVRALHRPQIRRGWDRMLLRVPILGGLLREILAARFARTLGMLLVNGVPLLGALAIVQDVLGNKAAETAVAAAAESAKSGQGMAAALGAGGVLPARLIHLLRLGEETAQLGPLAMRAADMFEERTRMALQRMVALLVPAITILMGAAVAGIVSSLMLAMLSLNGIAQ